MEGNPPGAPPALATEAFYEGLAPVYDREFEHRAPYVRAVNDIILTWVGQHRPATLLDVGCANGGRIQQLCADADLTAVGLDLTPAMVEEARRRDIDAFVADISAPQLPTDQMPVTSFDLIVCTWMFGHLRERDQRVRALRNLRSLLAPGGALIMDVNNPFNAAAYGWYSVARNALRAALRVRGAGDFVASRSAGGRTLGTVVHLFTRREILGLLRETGWTPVATSYVNYDTGDIDVSPRAGQLCITARGESV